MKEIIQEKYPQVKNVILCDSMEECLRDADVVNVAASGKIRPHIEERWLKPGCFVSLPAGIDMDMDFVAKRACLVTDNFKMYELRR